MSGLDLPGTTVPTNYWRRFTERAELCPTDAGGQGR
jgi:hypothetical protein